MNMSTFWEFFSWHHVMLIALNVLKLMWLLTLIYWLHIYKCATNVWIWIYVLYYIYIFTWGTLRVWTMLTLSIDFIGQCIVHVLDIYIMYALVSQGNYCCYRHYKNMCHRQQQTKEQFRMGDHMDEKELYCMVTHAQSFEALPDPSGLQWSEVVPRLARPVSIKFILSSVPIDTEYGHQMVYTLHKHIVALHQWVNLYEEASTMESRCAITSASPLYVDMACTPSSHLRSSSRSEKVSPNAFVEKLWVC